MYNDRYVTFINRLKEVIRSRTSKGDRKYNGQKRKTNNVLQNTTQTK
jgi:hypothetical protein